MPLHYICDYTIAYVNYFHYICTASHITGGRSRQRTGCPFFVLSRRSERSGDAPKGSKVVLPPLLPLTSLRDSRNPPVPQTVERLRHATAPLRPRLALSTLWPPPPPVRAAAPSTPPGLPPARETRRHRPDYAPGASPRPFPTHPGGFGGLRANWRPTGGQGKANRRAREGRG